MKLSLFSILLMLSPFALSSYAQTGSTNDRKDLPTLENLEIERKNPKMMVVIFIVRDYMKLRCDSIAESIDDNYYMKKRRKNDS